VSIRNARKGAIIEVSDTGPGIPPEVSEQLIYETLHPYPADLLIATKGGFVRPGPNRWEHDGRPEHLRTACEASLRRLHLARIDLYQFHSPDPAVPIADSLGELGRLQNEGKIRHIGVSNFDLEQLKEARGIVKVVSVQNRYNVTDRSSQAVADLCDQEQIVFIPWAPVQDADRNVGVLAAAERLGTGTRQVVLAWLLAQSRQFLPIPGTGSPEHVTENVAAAELELTGSELAAISHGG